MSMTVLIFYYRIVFIEELVQKNPFSHNTTLDITSASIDLNIFVKISIYLYETFCVQQG